MIKDSGNRTIFENGFQRDVQEGKGRFDLLPWRAIWQLAKHCEEGALKYGEHNIDRGCPQHLLISSAIRHLVKYQLGWDDEPHLRAALWNIAWALEQTETHPEMLDIPYKEEPEVKVNKGLNIMYTFTPSISDIMGSLFGPEHGKMAEKVFGEKEETNGQSESKP